jgi:hypothetical protein
MKRPSIVIRHITFTGPKVQPAEVKFKAGLNVLYGASNTGKSFTLNAINSMLGSDKAIPNPKLRRGYDGVWLGLEFGDGSTKTIFRPPNGGGFSIFDGLIKATPSTPGIPVDVNDLVLGACGLLGKKVVDNKDGHKQSLTIRTLAPYLLVSETAIIEERSPILTGQYTNVTAERNIFRLLLTGVDDSAVVTIEPRKTKKVRTEAKIEIINELISSLESELGDQLGSKHLVLDQEAKLTATIDDLMANLQSVQGEIDFNVSSRREAVDRRHNERSRFRELEITVGRFRWLLESYASDIERLMALEEAGALLAVRTTRACSLCGAAPEHQTHPQAAETIDLVKTAASTELRRIERDSRDLDATILSLSAEADGLRSSIEGLDADVERHGKAAADLRPREAELRAEFKKQWALRNKLLAMLRKFDERDDLIARREELNAAAKRKQPTRSSLVVGIDGPTGHAFAKVVQEVLRAWRFPNNPEVTFEDSTQDIRVNGEDRKDNGKGVRAVMHAAFKVALLIYCQRNNLPHPDFLVLDTPLLTYRDPITSRHGGLAPDEQLLKATTLKDGFYTHLDSLGSSVQIVILENGDPTQTIISQGKAQVFEGADGGERVGFFPPRNT